MPWVIKSCLGLSTFRNVPIGLGVSLHTYSPGYRYPGRVKHTETECFSINTSDSNEGPVPKASPVARIHSPFRDNAKVFMYRLEWKD
jgi:hypothetical protein